MPRFGWAPSEATKAKMRAAANARWSSPEARSKQSLATKGKRKGMPPSKACFDAQRTPEAQARRLAALREAFKRPATIARRQAAAKRVSQTPEARARLKANFSGNQTSEARRRWWARLTPKEREAFVAKRGQGQRKWWETATDDARQKRIDAGSEARKSGTKAYVDKISGMSRAELEQHMRQAWEAAKNNYQRMTPEHRAAFRKAQIKWNRARWDALDGDQRRDKMSAQIAALRQDWKQLSREDRVKRTAPGRRAAQMASPSSLEQVVSSVLEALGIRFERQKHIGPYTVDFYVSDRALVIECDGLYWHTRPGAPERDAKKDEWLRSLGHVVLRIPEVDIKSGAFLSALAEIA